MDVKFAKVLIEDMFAKMNGTSTKETKKEVKKEEPKIEISGTKTWNDADKKAAIIAELEEQGIFFDELAKETGKDIDPFDLICHIAFGQKPLTRRERANQVKKRDYFAKYGGTARKVLELLLDKYADEGIGNIEQLEVLRVAPLDQFGSPVEIIQAFGGKPQYQAAIRDLEQQLYH